MLERVGRAAARWRLAILAGWAVLAIIGGVFGGGVYDRTQTVDDTRGQSAQARERLDELDPEGELVVAIITGEDYFARSLIDGVPPVIYALRELPGVKEVKDAYTAGGMQGDDGRSSLVIVELDPGLEGDAALAVADRVTAQLKTIPAPEVLVGGKLLAERTFAEQATDDAVFGESIALVVLTIVLIAFLGGFLAGLMPLAAALATIAGSLLVLNALAGAVAVSEFAVNVVTLLGLGLAVDYSLLVIARFREERVGAPDASLEDQLGRTIAAAGRAVLVSGLAVGIALIALYVFADPVLSAMALGGVLAVATATLVGLTLVPALVAVGHRRIPARGRMPSVGLLARLATFAQRRPAPVALLVAAALIALSVPAFGIEVANADATSLPETAQERRVQQLLERNFLTGGIEPITVLSQRPPTDALPQRMVKLPGVEEILPIDTLPPTVAGYTVDPLGSDEGDRAQQLVRDIRALDPSLLVGGPAAELLDAKESTRDRLPLALLVVFVPTALLLFALTRSVLVPLKAIVMNVLTLLATLGLLALIFPGPLDLTTPLLLFMFIFGLSMDYEVFLIARIKEEWDRTGDNDRAVLAGITATGPVVTLAALSIGIVFAGFALGELTEVREIGVGMTLAVLLDVTVVRGLLLPAAMALLGRLNWWPGTVTRKTGQMV